MAERSEDCPLSLRIGLAAPFDPRDRLLDSGVLGSTFAAMEELVQEVVPLSGALPARLRRATHIGSVGARMRPGDLRHPRRAAARVYPAAQLGRPTIAVRNRQMRRRLAAAGPIDGIVQRGCELSLPSDRRFVTFEDSTVVQALESYPWPHLQALSAGDLRRYAERQRRAYGCAVACCCTTHWVAESITGSYGIPAERVFVVGTGCNLPIEAAAERDWSTPRYLFVGLDWERKNGDAVLGAFARVRERHPRARLDVVGIHPRLDVEGVVGHGPISRTGPQECERMAALYRSATAFVMPSVHEPAGIVYVEAARAGVPSIGTSHGGASTIIGDGGLTVDPLQPEQIYEAMLALADPDLARGMGALAHERSALFTWRKVAERLVRALAIPGVDCAGLADFL